ncbi:MAG: hypothetical protein V4614_04655 [Pseudomonadota bacterium]
MQTAFPLHVRLAWLWRKKELANLGKTLNLVLSQLCTASPVTFEMNSLLAQLARLMPFAPVAGLGAVDGVAQNLLERAEARAGRNPQQARELRRAAYAYISVVR